MYTNELSRWIAVNSCETLECLAKVIEDFADENGEIQGRTRTFNANIMAEYCRNFNSLPANTLTRNYNIRQQALYIISSNIKNKIKI